MPRGNLRATVVAMIGHALVNVPRHAHHPVSERWVAAGFAIGSVCFFVGPFPGFLQLVGDRADAWVFFIGSLFFTAAAGVSWCTRPSTALGATRRGGRPSRRCSPTAPAPDRGQWRP
jgi:hypothetical protein